MSGIIKLKLNAVKPVDILYKKLQAGLSGCSNPHMKIIGCANTPLRLVKGEHRISGVHL